MAPRSHQTIMLILAGEEPIGRTVKCFRENEHLDISDGACAVFDARNILPSRIPHATCHICDSSDECILRHAQVMAPLGYPSTHQIEFPIVCSQVRYMRHYA